MTKTNAASEGSSTRCGSADSKDGFHEVAVNMDSNAGDQSKMAPDLPGAGIVTPNPLSVPPSNDPIADLARLYPKGCELAKAQRILAYYAIGAMLPKPTKATTRSTAYRNNPVTAFLKTWEAQGGMALSSSTVKLCRQLHAGFSQIEIDAAVCAQIPWTALRELSQERVPGPLRARLLAELCSGTLKASEVAGRLDAEIPGRPRQGRQPSNRMEVLRRIHDAASDLKESMTGVADPVWAALQTDKRSAKLLIDAVTTTLRSGLSQWRDELKKAHRRRG
jgi:hypothetical protein